MRGMRTAGQDFSTDFGDLKASDTELPLARAQKSTLEKSATYFDIYDLRVTCETRAGISDVNYSAIINLLHDAGVRYREERRYNVKPDRVLMEILVQKEDIPAINDLNKEYGDKGYTFTFNDNLPEDIQDRIITTPEKELEVKVTEDTAKSASKKTAMELGESYEVRLPDYSLSYIVNGDDSGIDEDDRANIDEYMTQFGTDPVIDVGDEEGSFDPNPEFGLPTNTVPATITVRSTKKTAGEDPLGAPEDEPKVGEYADDILPQIKDKLEEGFDDIATEYELDSVKGDEVEHESRDGFMPFTDGGFEVSGYTSIDYLSATGKGLPTEALDKEVARVQDDAYTDSKEEFLKEFPEIGEELGADLDYNTLQDKGYGDEAETLSEMERDYMVASILFHITAYYYAPGNARSDFPESNSLYVKYAVNTDYDYHREKGDVIVAETEFAFDTVEELGQELDKFLSGIKTMEYKTETPETVED